MGQGVKGSGGGICVCVVSAGFVCVCTVFGFGTCSTEMKTKSKQGALFQRGSIGCYHLTFQKTEAR